MFLHRSVVWKINSQTAKKLEQKAHTRFIYCLPFCYVSMVGKKIHCNGILMDTCTLFPINICEIDVFPFSQTTFLLRKEDN